MYVFQISEVEIDHGRITFLSILCRYCNLDQKGFNDKIQSLPYRGRPRLIQNSKVLSTCEFVRWFKYSPCDEALTGAGVSGAAASTLSTPQAARIGEDGLR